MLLTEGVLQGSGWFLARTLDNTRWQSQPEYLNGSRYVLYADGHLEKISQAEIPAGKWVDRLFWQGLSNP
jgi:prepilin-type processing-associated H-X9-DG protein